MLLQRVIHLAIGILMLRDSRVPTLVRASRSGDGDGAMNDTTQRHGGRPILAIRCLFELNQAEEP